MIIFDIADRIRRYLEETVTPEVELKKPNDGDTNTFELVNPAVYATHRPRPAVGSEILLVPSVTVIVPSVTEDLSSAFSKADVTLLFLISDPGQQIRKKQNDGSYSGLTFTAANEGWHDLANAMDATVRHMRNSFSKTGLGLSGEIKTQLFLTDEDGNPLPDYVDYYAGWVGFTALHGTTRKPEWGSYL